MKPKLKTFNVTSYENCHYTQIVQAENEDDAIEKAREIGDWGAPEFGEVEEQVAEEITDGYPEEVSND
jgi:hypothetical protein